MHSFENKVVLLGYYGSDKTHALSAWCSTYDELNIDLSVEVKNRIEELYQATIKNKKNSMKDLLKLLAESKHETPFEKSLFHFQIETDIASHIHLLKHRIGVSTNASSSRYKELNDDKFYVPYDWPQEEIEKHIEFCEYALLEYHRLVATLTTHFVNQGMTRKKARDRAKESARYKLPYSKQLICDVSFNFRSLYHFLELRYNEHAQKEICDIACKMLVEVAKLNHFDLTLKAFGLIDDNKHIRNPFS